MSKKNKKSSWQTVEEYQNQKLKDSTGAAITAAEAARLKSALSKDPYTSRNEFKPGFYDQKDKPATTVETIKGTAAKPTPKITDTESFVGGGEVELTKGKDYIKDLL
jgi:hypothetical protein